MATVSNTLKLNDKMMGVLKSVTRSMQMTLRVMEDLDKSASGLDVSKNLSAATVAARQASAAVAGLDEELDAATNAANRTDKSVFGIAKTAAIVTAAAYGIQKAFDFVVAVPARLSDQFTMTAARLDLINDGLRTSHELQDMIFASANRARAPFQDTADIVAKIGMNAGDAFKSVEEMVAFSELLNKSFKIGGASAEEQSGAMRQLSQALASGVLRGEEFNSIAENAPSVAKAVERYINAQGLNPDNMSLREIAAEGMISAGIVKNAMFSAADDINAKFEQIPQTWEGAMTVIKNNATQQFRPVLEQINRLANSERFQKLANDVVSGFAVMAGYALAAIDILAGGAAFVYDNWSWIAPLLLGVAAAWGVYTIAVNSAKIAEMAQATWTGIVTAAKVVAAGVTMALTGATAANTAAQWGLNAALLACPITWIIILIIALIAIIYSVVAAVNHFAGTSISATGVIAGAFMWLMALIGNIVIGEINAIIQMLWTMFVEPFIGIIEWILNVTQGGFDSFGGAVASLIGQIISWFLSLGKVVTKIIDAIFGTNWTSGLNDLQDSVLAWGKSDKSITLERKAPTIDYRFDMTDAYDTGYSWGEGVDDKLSGIADNLGDLTGGMPDFSSMGGDPLDNIDRVGSVGRIEDDVTISDEDIKMLKDLATLEYQVNMTQLTPQLSATFGDIRETADAGAILTFIEDSVAEALSSSLVVQN